jgi:hypothetical protein
MLAQTARSSAIAVRVSRQVVYREIEAVLLE